MLCLIDFDSGQHHPGVQCWSVCDRASVFWSVRSQRLANSFQAAVVLPCAILFSYTQWAPWLNAASSPLPLDHFQHALIFSQPPLCLTSLPVLLSLLGSPNFPFHTPSLLYSLCTLLHSFAFSFSYPDNVGIAGKSRFLFCIFHTFATHSKNTFV